MSQPFPIDRKTVAGMVHVAALPGTPRGTASVDEIASRARDEAALLRELGFDAIVVENMHDRPYLKGAAIGSEIVAAMTTVSSAVREAAGDLPCGIQILAAGNRQALACAVAARLDFIRAEGFVFGHVADEGIIESDGADLTRYRRELGADDIAILTDIKKKHSSHAITADVDIAETARAAAYFLSDGLIVTGDSTGHGADLREVRDVKSAVPELPVIVGSGITPESVAAFLEIADAVIVGSDIKEDGHWGNPIDPERARRLLDACRS